MKLTRLALARLIWDSEAMGCGCCGRSRLSAEQEAFVNEHGLDENSLQIADEILAAENEPAK